MKLRRVAASAIATMTLAATLAGTAAAVPVHKAGANYTTTTEDGLTLTIKRTAEQFDVKLPDNLSIFSHQTFLDTKGVATIKGAKGKDVDAHIMIGYQIGCMVDVSDGVTLVYRAPRLSTGVELENSLNGTPELSFGGDSLNEVNGIGASSTLRPNAGLEVPLGLDAMFTVRPGQILTFLVAEKDIKGNKGALRYVGEPINIDGCFGFASVRSFVTLWTKAPIEDSKITTWGRVTRF
ncbi:MAG: MspA family porin [Lawsonella sp.]